MESNNRINVFTNYEALLKETIDWYNPLYNTDFYIEKYVLDEVRFAVVRFSQATNDDIFRFAHLYGMVEFKKINNITITDKPRFGQ